VASSVVHRRFHPLGPSLRPVPRPARPTPPCDHVQPLVKAEGAC
jgi:hypothetical protein